MATENTASTGSALNLGDIYHVLFKRKWLILFFSLAGFAAAGYVYFKMRPPYQSEAMLLVKYVEEDKGPIPVTPTEIRQADARGEGILGTETDILRSLDVAGAVVDTVGVQKIFGKGTTETNRNIAALVLQRNLQVDIPKKGTVLRVTYSSPDVESVQPVLTQVIETYLKFHSDIHRSLGKYDDFLKAQSDEVRAKLGITQEELRKLMDQVGTFSVEETKKEFADRRVRLQDELSRAKAELAERMAALEAIRKTRPSVVNSAPSAKAADSTNVTTTAQVATTNKTEVAKASTEGKAPTTTAMVKPPRDVVSDYKQVMDSLDDFRKQRQELGKTFTSESVFIKELNGQMAQLEAKRAKLEEQYPALLSEPVAVERNAASASSSSDKGFDEEGEMVRIASLNARIKQLTEQSDQLKDDLSKFANAESAITKLQLQKEIEENKYKSYVSSLDRARLEATLAAGKAANISVIQEPSPPLRDSSKFYKKLGMAVGGGIGGGLALAFLLELVLNQSVRKATDIGNLLKLPVFVSIPEFRNGGRKKAHEPAQLGNGESENGEMLPVKAAKANGIEPWDEHHELHPYSEALRDRLVTFFEVKGMTHKPKLIAVTSCGHGAGVTSVAAGLAASLSETGEGNVLLVDMNMKQGAAHPFYKGKPACGLEDVLSLETRGEAKINEKLYLVTGTGMDRDSRLPRILPKRFTHLLPKLQASDYDYIIFDMPPVTQTSVTPRLTALMDMVLLMVESGKTNRDILKQASSLISETKANLGVILNRRRNYVPQWLHQEF